MQERKRPRFPPQLLDLLATGQMGEYSLSPWGSNYTFFTTVSDGIQDGCKVVYKPRQGEAPLWDFPPGTLYLREYAAYLLSEALGWCFVPPTVVRDGSYGVGTVQLYMESVHGATYIDTLDKYQDEFMRLCAFDVIANNADRKAGHCLLGMDGFIWAIDHGICFNSEPKLRTVIWEFAGEEVPKAIQKDLAGFLKTFKRPGGFGEQLAALPLSGEEVEAFRRRVEALVERPVFPYPGQRRAVPWPPV